MYNTKLVIQYCAFPADHEQRKSTTESLGGSEILSANFHCVLIIYFHLHSIGWLAGSLNRNPPFTTNEREPVLLND